MAPARLVYSQPLTKFLVVGTLSTRTEHAPGRLSALVLEPVNIHSKNMSSDLAYQSLNMRPTVKIAKWYLNLLPAYPGDYLTTPGEKERATMEYEDEQSVFGFHHFFDRPINFTGKSVLDLGCGYGGRTVRYKEAGASRVVGVEIRPDMVKQAEAFAEAHGVEIEFMVGKGEAQPLPDNSFDIVCAYDVFEHVESVENTLRECFRVLKQGGTLFTVFPPFYHPTNGSHFEGYISRSPFDTLFFAPETLMAAAEEIMVERLYKYRPNPLRPTDKIWTLNGITVREFLRMLGGVAFSQKRIALDPLLSSKRRGWPKYGMRYYAWVFSLGARIPVLREICTHRIVAELTK